MPLLRAQLAEATRNALMSRATCWRDVARLHEGQQPRADHGPSAAGVGGSPGAHQIHRAGDASETSAQTADPRIPEANKQKKQTAKKAKKATKRWGSKDGCWAGGIYFGWRVYSFLERNPPLLEQPVVSRTVIFTCAGCGCFV